MADNFQEVAKQFVQFYYQQFDSDREQLAPLYRDTSMLTYESESMSGVIPIINKLKVTPLSPPRPFFPSFCFFTCRDVYTILLPSLGDRAQTRLRAMIMTTTMLINTMI